MIAQSEQVFAKTSGAKSLALNFYGGPGSTSPLIEITRLKEMSIKPNWILSVGGQIPIHQFEAPFEIEGDLQLAREMIGYQESAALLLNGAISLRWKKTPWSETATFAFGHGLSYATIPPTIERMYLDRTNRLLYYMLIEFTVPLLNLKNYDLLLRVHHRSGAFGLFEGVVGGSDYLCLGIRIRELF